MAVSCEGEVAGIVLRRGESAAFLTRRRAVGRRGKGLQAVVALGGGAGGHDDAGAVFAAYCRGVVQHRGFAAAAGVNSKRLAEVVAAGQRQVKVVAVFGTVGEEGVGFAGVQFDFDIRLFAGEELADHGFVREFARFHPLAVGFHQVVQLGEVDVVGDVLDDGVFFVDTGLKELAGGEWQADEQDEGVFHGVPCG